MQTTKTMLTFTVLIEAFPLLRLPAIRYAVLLHIMKRIVSIALFFVILTVSGQNPLKHESGNSVIDTSILMKRTIPDCPLCCSWLNVIIKTPEPNQVCQIQFKNKRDAKKYYKKKEKLLYDTDWQTIWPDLINEQVMLTWIGIKSEEPKFYDTSYHYFCKKCKYIFK
jgi:hypothetical protein